MLCKLPQTCTASVFKVTQSQAVYDIAELTVHTHTHTHFIKQNIFVLLLVLLLPKQKSTNMIYCKFLFFISCRESFLSLVSIYYWFVEDWKIRKFVYTVSLTGWARMLREVRHTCVTELVTCSGLMQSTCCTNCVAHCTCSLRSGEERFMSRPSLSVCLYHGLCLTLRCSELLETKIDNRAMYGLKAWTEGARKWVRDLTAVTVCWKEWSDVTGCCEITAECEVIVNQRVKHKTRFEVTWVLET
jgi:hypothetical protein